MNKIKTALLSYGMSGRVFHEPFLALHPGFEIYAVLERSKNLAQAKHPSIITYREIGELLKNPAIDLVIVNTPNSTHVDFTRQAILAGKHVIVEKPFTATTAEAQELIDLAQTNGVQLSVFHNRRWDSDFLTVKRIIDQQLLGEIVEAEIHYDRFNPQLSVKVHKETPGKGIGTLYDLGSHIIDQALQLFGMPSHVFADLTSFRPGSQIDDYSEVVLFYTTMRVRIKTNYLVKEPVPAYVLHGRRGSFLKSRADVQETRLQAGDNPGTSDWGVEPVSERGMLHTEINGTIVRERVLTERGNYYTYYDGVYKALTNGDAMPVNGFEAMQVITIIEKALESSAGKIVVGV